jgi:signal transduction histidine kinase
MGSSGGPPTLRTREFAHQMRDMLTAVLGSLEQLHQQSLDEQGRHQLARAEAAALRAIDLLNRYAPLSDPDRQDGYKAEQSRC